MGFRNIRPDGLPVVANTVERMTLKPGTDGYTVIQNDTKGIYSWNVSTQTWIAQTSGQGGTVTSVNGQTGTVVLTKSDFGLANVDNTSDANKPVSTAQQTALNLKANIASPTFTGTPSAPTQTQGDNSTKLATTSYVDAGLSGKQPSGNYITDLTGDATASGPGSSALTLSTVNSNVGSFGSASSTNTFTVNAKGLVTAVTNNVIQIAESQVTNLTIDLALKAPLASPAFTGVPTAPTQTQSDNSTKLATTSYVDTGLSTKQSTGNYITAITGDLSASGPGSAVGTLATVNSNTGSFGNATSTGTFTVNGKGLITAASSTSIQIAESQVTNLVTDLAGKQPTGNYMTSVTGDATGSGPGATTLTLSTVNASPGTFGSASTSLNATVNAKGLITSLSTNSIQIAESQVTNLTTDLALKAPLASPSFTGSPTAPTQTQADNSTKLATTAYVDTGLATKQVTGNYITALTGDVTASGPGSAASTLATVNSNVGTFPLASVTADAKGRITAVSSGSVPITDIQIFNASGTWTKPIGPNGELAKKVTMYLLAGGGGGGSGRKGLAGTVRCGGGGASSSAVTIFTTIASAFGATEAVTIGAGGTGGAAITVNSTSGASGLNGGATNFNVFTAVHGGPGSGGTATSGSGGSTVSVATFSTIVGGTGASASTTGSVGGTATSGSTSGGTSGGGAGGGIVVGDAAANAGQGGQLILNQFSSLTLAGGTQGTVGAGSAGGNGGNVNIFYGMPSGTGGGGGAGSISTNAGSGGSGGAGAGGGGGGAALDSVGNSGAGGPGGNGWAVLVTEF